MALDNAQFISELSITDPPGTDPLSQGDDQIRTTKRATFQSFPFIDKQVDLSADQLNEAAIKNEQNVFVADQTIRANLTMQQQSDSLPSLFSWTQFTGDILRWQLSTTAETSGAPLQFSLVLFDDTGAFQSVPWSCDAVTGVVNFAEVPTVGGDPIWIAGEVRMLVQGSTVPAGNWFEANGTNGTVALQDRIMGAQGVFFGTQTPFLDVQTDVGPTTGSTALTTTQMPSHNHRARDGSAGGVTDSTIGAVSNETVLGGSRGTPVGFYSNLNSQGNEIVESTGGGAGHTHTIPELECNPASNDAFQVMPYTYFFIVIQYVP